MKTFLMAASALAGGLLMSGGAQAQSCTGVCGTASPNGVVTAAPDGGTTYSYITTDGGVSGAGQIATVGGSTGSEYITNDFTAAVGDELNLYFNFVTSDGGTFSDYAFAALRDISNVANPIYLFTARTTPSGNTSPGFGLPANSSTLDPSSTPINQGASTWAQLGTDSGSCYNGTANGCGSTGWIKSTYTFTTAGTFNIRLGVTNVSDSSYDTGLAFSGITVNNAPIGGAVPEPATWAMLMLGFGLVGAAARRRRGIAVLG